MPYNKHDKNFYVSLDSSNAMQLNYNRRDEQFEPDIPNFVIGKIEQHCQMYISKQPGVYIYIYIYI